MATTNIYGPESGSIAVAGGESNLASGTVGIVPSPLGASHNYEVRTNPTAAAALVQLGQVDSAGTVPSIYRSVRFGLRIAALPSAGTRIVALSDGTSYFDMLTLNSNGTLSIGRALVLDATSTKAFIPDGKLHWIEFDVGWSSGNGRRVFVDGEEWASVATTASVAKGRQVFGVIDATTAYLLFSGIVSDDANLATIWGSWKVGILLPVSDSAINSWVGGAGGTTNLFEAVNNVPPVGVATTADTNTSQVKNANATVPNNLDLACQSYSNFGLKEDDIIRAVHATTVHGEGAASGSKTGTVEILSNPASGSSNTFLAGVNVGAIGTYSTNWYTRSGPVTESPTVTLTTQPVVRIAKTNANTGEVHLCWAGIYVAYTPQDTPELHGRPFGLSGHRQMNQLLVQ